MKLPDEVYTQLNHLLEQKENLQWEIGDFIIELWDEIKRYTPKKDWRKEHARLLNDLAENTGSHYGTLGNLERMSGFYSHEWRERWQPPLSYYQLRACKAAGEDWERWCEWAVGEGANPYTGRPASGDAIRDAIKGEQSKEEIATRILNDIRKKAGRLLEISYGNQWALMITAIVDDALGDNDGKE